MVLFAYHFATKFLNHKCRRVVAMVTVRLGKRAAVGSPGILRLGGLVGRTRLKRHVNRSAEEISRNRPHDRNELTVCLQLFEVKGEVGRDLEDDGGTLNGKGRRLLEPCMPPGPGAVTYLGDERRPHGRKPGHVQAGDRLERGRGVLDDLQLKRAVGYSFGLRSLIGRRLERYVVDTG